MEALIASTWPDSFRSPGINYAGIVNYIISETVRKQ